MLKCVKSVWETLSSNTAIATPDSHVATKNTKMDANLSNAAFGGTLQQDVKQCCE